MKKILVYFPYPLKPGKSGSAVRPQKILDAFKEYGKNKGIDIISIYGESNVRKRKLKKLYKEVNCNDILFCYMENSTLPYWLTDFDHLPRTPFMEYNFFKFLRKGNIPLGLFYRDVYWKFNDQYPLKGMKRFIMRIIYRMELFLYKKYADHFFLPSIEMNNFIHFPNKIISSLPPGANKMLETTENTKLNVKEESVLKLIYVGGISRRYGLKKMLKAASIAIKSGTNIELHLVCREEEYAKYEDEFKNYKSCSWLKIYHAYGKELEDIYNKVNAGIIPIQKNKYNDFAVPVKLFEYISYGLPIVSTNCNAQGKVVKKDNLGIVVKDDPNSLAEGIKYLANIEERNTYSENVKKALLNKHLWLHRVEKIVKSLNKRDL